MKKIRLGNDIKFNWSLLNSEGEPYNIEGADLRITYTTFRGVTEVTDFSVSGNVVSWVFKGKDQKVLGDYIITLQKNAGEDGMITIDKCSAFRLVARSCDAGGETACSHLQIETVDITSTLDVQQIATGGTAKWDEIEGKPDNFADWNAEEGDEKFIANKPTIPSKNSQLQNDSNFATKEDIPDTSTFITNTVNNLANYYLKEETYTKQEVVALINQITTINFKVVDELPSSGESNLIYLVKKEGSGDDVYDEYIGVESKWEKIGSTTVDLTNYYTKTDADGRFALKTSIADMLTKTEAAEIYIQEAPKDGKTYGRNNKQWVEIVGGEGGSIVVDAELSKTSTNPVQNRAIASRVSETYENFAAIQGSGETDLNKIYIDAETNTSYRFNGTEFVSIGGGSKDNYEECEGIYGLSNGNYINLSVNTDLVDYINSLDVISLIFCCKNNDTNASVDWRRYLGMINSENSNKLVVCQLHYTGKFRLFNNEYEGYLSGYKNILSFNRSNGKLIAYNEVGKYFEGTNEDSIQPDWIKLHNPAKPYIQYFSGDVKNALLELVWLNFDVDRILQFNFTLLYYLRNFKKSGILPTNLIHESYSPELIEKHEPSLYGNYWTTTEKDSEGYTVSSTDIENKGIMVGINCSGSKFENKACEVITTIEIVEGSVKVVNADNALPYNAKLYDIVNKETGEHKAINEELTVGTWDIIVDTWAKNLYGPVISSIQVPAKIKCISQKFTPYAAIMQWKGDKLFNGNQIYDGVTKELRNVDTNMHNAKTTFVGTIPIDSPTYATKAPTSSNKPRFIGEKYYDTATGDIYEAGDFTAFKKLNS